MTSACSGLVSGGSHALPVVPQTKVTTSVNLLVNGDAETGDATLTGYDSVTIPGWVESGLPTVVAYGVKGFPSKKSPGAGDGNNFFTGGPFGSSTLTQGADVSSAAHAIDGGRVKCTLSGLLGGNGSSRDDAAVTATFLDIRGHVLGSAVIGPVTNAQRKNATSFVAQSKTAAVPAKTRHIRVSVRFTQYEKFSEGKSLDNGYADDLSLTLSTVVSAPPLPTPPPANVPAFDHVFFVYFENSNYDQIIGNTAQAPYINQLARQYSLLGRYYSLHHPSDANYVLQAAGGTYGLHQNDFYSHKIAAQHLADLVEAAGGTWKQYMESAHGACDQTEHGYYYPDDGPYMYFDDVRKNAARCKAHVVPWSNFAKDLASTLTTPTYAWLSPDDCDDMESCGIKAGDDFLKKEIMKPLLASPAWNEQQTLLVVAWDEDDFTPVQHIPGIFLSPYQVKNGYTSTILYTHYSVLHTIEAALDLPTLTNNDLYATPINDIWR